MFGSVRKTDDMLKVYSTRAINQASVIIEKYVLLPFKMFTILSVSEIFAKFTVYIKRRDDINI